MSTVVYARYSSHRQGEQSIEGQLAEARRYATEHGLSIIYEYIDRAMTGKNDEREQFQQMLADASKQAFDTLIVWKTDRIGRNKEEIALNKYHLRKNGVKIHYVAEFIPDTPEGIILESVIEGMAAYYSEQLSQNVRRGMRRSAEKAQSVGGNIPLGYTVGADKKFVIDPQTAPVVRTIFELYSAGKSSVEVIEHLNANGYRTAKGQLFNKNSIRSVLKNPKYIGIYTYKDEVRIEGAIPPLIEKEVFYKVQEMLKINQKFGGHRKKTVGNGFLLTGRLFCGRCGHGMVGYSGTSKTGGKHHYYACTEQKRKRCSKRAVRRDWIERLVMERVLKLVNDAELLDFIAERTYAYYQKQNTDSSYTKSLNRALDEVNKSIFNLVRALEAGIFNETTKARMEELEEQRAELENACAESRLKADLGITKDHILFFLHQFAEYDYSDIECQKRLIKTFVNSVFVYDDKVVITFNYSGDHRTITLMEIDAGLTTPVHVLSGKAHHIINVAALKSCGFSAAAFLF